MVNISILLFIAIVIGSVALGGIGGYFLSIYVMSKRAFRRVGRKF